MVKNFDRVIKEADGSDYLEAKPTGKFTSIGQALFEVTDGVTDMCTVKFSKVIGNALKLGVSQENLNSDEYIERWNLMQKIAKGGDIELSANAITIIRNLIIQSKISPFIIGQICVYLNEPELTA